MCLQLHAITHRPEKSHSNRLWRENDRRKQNRFLVPERFFRKKKKKNRKKGFGCRCLENPVLNCHKDRVFSETPLILEISTRGSRPPVLRAASKGPQGNFNGLLKFFFRKSQLVWYIFRHAMLSLTISIEKRTSVGIARVNPGQLFETPGPW